MITTCMPQKYGEMRPFNSDRTFNSSLIVNHENVFNGFNYKNNFVKCISLDVDLTNHRHIKAINFHYNLTKLLANWKTRRKFGFKFHRKGQFLIGNEPIFKEYFGIKSNWLVPWESYEFPIDELEFIEGRNSKSNRCGNDLLNYDDEVVKKYISHKGCRAPYIKRYNSLPLCNTSKEISSAKLTYGNAKATECDWPCKRISKLVNYDREDTIEDMDNLFRIRIIFPDEVKTIVQSKEVDIHTLIGNIGGYLGLFMGYAVVQIPSLIFGAYDFLKSKSQSMSPSSQSLA